MEENWSVRKPGDVANKNIATGEMEINDNTVFRAIRNSVYNAAEKLAGLADEITMDATSKGEQATVVIAVSSQWTVVDFSIAVTFLRGCSSGRKHRVVHGDASMSRQAFG
ncbi:uncharacterized protein LOC143305323 [Osmia lignaria lignaria]|uniref:uncharacterized protein LOC143305323 n=1 Tax=Osmia lignaria lignaria TaxID=1437193 RepID=UPI00402B0716